MTSETSHDRNVARRNPPPNSLATVPLSVLNILPESKSLNTVRESDSEVYVLDSPPPGHHVRLDLSSGSYIFCAFETLVNNAQIISENIAGERYFLRVD